MNDIPPVDETKIWVVDFETDNLNDDNRAFSASPFSSKNGIVVGCWSVVDISSEDGEYDVKSGTFRSDEEETSLPEEINEPEGSPYKYLPWLLCGHNIRYDLQFLRTTGGRANYYPARVAEGTITLWDTQFAEYLLTGQKEKMVSLNYLAEKYGLGSKHDEVKEMWDAGYKTHEIDPEVLDEYVRHDVHLTTEIALRQIALAFETEMLDFILFQMRSLFVVSEYEYNGMYVDKDQLSRLKEFGKDQSYLYAYNARIEFMKYCYRTGISTKLSKDRGIDIVEAESILIEYWFDVDSPDKLKRLVFGGKMEFNTKVPDGYYKSGKKKGQRKYKNEKFEFDLPAKLSPENIPEDYLTPKGKEKYQKCQEISFKEVSLDNKSIDYINDLLPVSSTESSTTCVRAILNKIVNYRDWDKFSTTYCQAVEDYLFEEDSCIHGNLNVDNTPTGRLTSSNPNMQNMPSKEDSEFKTVFSSRFPNGNIGTVDFKQLEIIGLAYLTQDPQLVADLMNDRDIHYETGKTAGLWYSPLEVRADTRKEIKRLNFGSIYGAGEKKLASQGTMDKATVSKCLRALKTRYGTAFGKEYIEELVRKLDLYAEKLERTDSGTRRFGNYLKQPTGRKIWIETREDYREKRQVWPYTCLRNYPVQSIAADIVAVARVLFYDVIREMNEQDNILMVNEVHDEIVFDMTEDGSKVFKGIVEIVENRLPGVLNKIYNLNPEFDLPLKLEVGIGDNWKLAK